MGSGTIGIGSASTDVFGVSKSSASARLFIAASRAVSGFSPQRHSINFKMEV
jgi:hypothetical protein